MAHVTNSRMTFGSILGMLSTAANTVTSTLNVVGDGVDMLQNSVSDMKEQQLIRSAEDMAVYEEEYSLLTAKRFAETILDSQEYREKSTKHAQAYDQARQLIAERKAARKKS